MNICVVTSSYPRFSGDAAGSFVHEMCASMQNIGDNLVVVAPHSKDSLHHEVIDGVEVYRFNYAPNEQLENLAYGYGIWDNIRHRKTAALQIPAFLSQCAKTYLELAVAHDFDVIFAQWALPMGLACVASKRKLAKPVAILSHGSDVFLARSFLFRSLAGYTLRNSDLILANSRATCNRIREIGVLRPIHVVYMGVNLDRFRAGTPQPAADSRRRILFVGRLTRRKGIGLLVRAMKRIIQEVDCRLEVVGGGPLREELIQYCGFNRLDHRVAFREHVPPQELSNLYSNSDLFVLPSITTEEGETEALGVVLLEAMASGKAVVAGNVGGIPELIRHNVNGILVDPCNLNELVRAIVDLLTDDKRRTKMGEEGRRMAQQYSWETVARRIHTLLVKVAS